MAQAPSLVIRSLEVGCLAACWTRARCCIACGGASSLRTHDGQWLSEPNLIVFQTSTARARSEVKGSLLYFPLGLHAGPNTSLVH